MSSFILHGHGTVCADGTRGSRGCKCLDKGLTGFLKDGLKSGISLKNIQKRQLN